MNIFLQAHRDNQRKIREAKLAKTKQYFQDLKNGVEACMAGIEHKNGRGFGYDSDYAKQYALEQIETNRSEASE